MRIARVAWAFFSIGFLAGSFENAASLGLTKASRTAQENRVDAAVLRSTAAVMATFQSIGGGFPEELLARPLVPRGEAPEAVSAALLELLEEQPLAGTLTPVLFAPQGRAELALGAPSDLTQRRRFGERRMISEPDRLPLSVMPAPISLPPPVPQEKIPNARTGRDQEGVVRQEFIMPFERGRVTSLFHQGRYHPAIDLAGRLGTPVHATTRRQRVAFTGWRRGYGNTVVTRDGAGRQHLYAHLQRIITKVGTVLDQGQVLGRLGSTGRSTGPHVHYEVRARSGRHINPVTLLFPGRRVGRGLAWNGARSVTRFAGRADRGQPRPR